MVGWFNVQNGLEKVIRAKPTLVENRTCLTVYAEREFYVRNKLERKTAFGFFLHVSWQGFGRHSENQLHFLQAH